MANPSRGELPIIQAAIELIRCTCPCSMACPAPTSSASAKRATLTLLRRAASAFWKQPCGVKDCQDFDVITLLAIDDSERRLDLLAQVGSWSFRYPSPRVWKINELFGCGEKLLDRVISVYGRVTGNEFMDRLQVIHCLLGPADPAHSLRCFRTALVE